LENCILIKEAGCALTKTLVSSITAQSVGFVLGFGSFVWEVTRFKVELALSL